MKAFGRILVIVSEGDTCPEFSSLNSRFFHRNLFLCLKKSHARTYLISRKDIPCFKTQKPNACFFY